MFSGFDREIFKFFEELENNNRRDWFLENKPRYEALVMQPALELVQEMEKGLKKISPHFVAVAKRSGGSIMRIYRDVRFSKSKTPYKTNLGIHFRHEMGKDVHAPGFYFHIDTDSVFVGAGIWHPDNPTLKLIRAAIDDQQPRWKRTTNKKTYRELYDAHGDRLKRPPRGFDADHPLMEDLKRKDFIGLATLKRTELYSPQLIDTLVSKYKVAMPYVRFLCDAIRLPC